MIYSNKNLRKFIKFLNGSFFHHDHQKVSLKTEMFRIPLMAFPVPSFFFFQSNYVKIYSGAIFFILT